MNIRLNIKFLILCNWTIGEILLDGKFQTLEKFRVLRSEYAYADIYVSLQKNEFNYDSILSKWVH